MNGGVITSEFAIDVYGDEHSDGDVDDDEYTESKYLRTRKKMKNLIGNKKMES